MAMTSLVMNPLVAAAGFLAVASLVMNPLALLSARVVRRGIHE